MILTAEHWNAARTDYASAVDKITNRRAGKILDNQARINLAVLVEYRNQLITRACREALS